MTNFHNPDCHQSLSAESRGTWLKATQTQELQHMELGLPTCLWNTENRNRGTPTLPGLITILVTAQTDPLSVSKLLSFVVSFRHKKLPFLMRNYTASTYCMDVRMGSRVSHAACSKRSPDWLLAYCDSTGVSGNRLSASAQLSFS